MHSNDLKAPLKPQLLNLSSIVSRLLGGAMIAIMLLVLLNFVAPYIDDARCFAYLRSALTFERKIEEAVRSNIATRYAGQHSTRCMVINRVFTLSSTLRRAGARSHKQPRYQRARAAP